MEHFAHLPPATYGEPPDLAVEIDLGTRRARDSRPTRYLWTSVAMVALGGLVAGGGVVGWSYYKRQTSRVTAPEPTAPPVNIVVKQPAPEATPVVDEGEGGIPQAEPLAEEKSAPEVARPTLSKPTATPIQRAKRVARSARKRAATEDRPPAQPASDDSWEDPYR